MVFVLFTIIIIFQALPNSLNNISRRSKALTEYVEYLEQSYLKADTQEEQSDVETQVSYQ